MMKKMKACKIVIMAMLMMLLCVGCSTEEVTDIANDALDKLETVVPASGENKEDLEEKDENITEDKETVDSKENAGKETVDSKENADKETVAETNAIPAFTGKAYAVMNNNVPDFKKSDMKTKSYENYGVLDSLGRCSVAMANIGKDLMPTEDRGAIGRVKPSGWHTVKYDCVDGKYLYNRCHLIGFQLTGENANERNLITGTRYMNVDGMLPFEDMVADYIKETSNHVLYRVTPIYQGNNLVATGVQMEAKSVEDNGDGICFNVFVFNVQPGVTINYATGDSKLSNGSSGTIVKPTAKAYSSKNNAVKNNTSNKNNTTKKNNKTVKENNTQNSKTYILNTNTKKYHNNGCRTISRMSEKNKKVYKGTSDSLQKQGYSACKICN